MIASVGRYRIVQELPKRFGRSTWLTYDATLGRRVRLEVVPVADPLAEALRARFAREAQVASQVHHACIATVYDAGTADEFHYIARQSLEGASVRERCARREPIGAAGLVQVAADIASALQSLHEHGLVHGEVEAESIHVTNDGHAFLDGFGLASTASESGATPEDDLHDLGNVLASMSSHATAVPPDLERLIDELRARRPTTAALLSEELRRMQGGSEAPGRDESTITVVIPRSRSNRGIRTRVVIAAILIVALGAGLTYLLGRPKVDVPSVAMLPLVEEHPDSTGIDPLMDGIGESVVTKLSQVAGVRVTPWITVQRYVETDQPLTEMARELNVAQLILGSFDGAGDSVRVAVRLVDGATGTERWRTEYSGLRTDVLELQRDLAVDVARELRVRLTAEQRRSLQRPASASTDAWECYLRAGQAMEEEDRASYQRALELFEQALSLDPDLAEAYVGVGAVRTALHYRGWDLENLGLAETCFRRALVLDPKLARARRGLIRVHFQRGEDEACLKIGQEVERLGLGDVENLLVRADALHFGELFEEAVETYQRVLELDPANEGAWGFLVITLHCMGRNEEAIRLGREYLDRFGSNPEIVMFVSLSAGCLKRWEEALAYLRNDMRFSGAWARLLAEPYRQLGHHEEAQRVLLESRGALEWLLQEEPNHAGNLELLVGCCTQLGDRVAAEAYLGRLARIVERDLKGTATLGSCRLMLGDAEGCVALWRESVRRGHLYLLGVSSNDPEHALLQNAVGYSEFVAERAQLKARWRAQYAPRGEP